MNAFRHIAALVLVLGMWWLAGCQPRARNGVVSPGARGDAQPAIAVERVVGGLQEPVSLVFLSRTQWLVAERRGGRIRWIENGTLRDEPFAVVPVPAPAGYHEYGLLGLAVDPEYPERPYVYAFHTVGANGRAMGQRVVRFTVRDGRGTAMTTLVDNLPAGQRCCHNGGRLLFGQDGMLYVTLGDTQRPELAQNYDALPGKVLRYARDGSIPRDNPFEQQRTAWAGTESDDPSKAQPLSGVRTPVYAIGLRNPFGLAMNPEDGAMYLTDNGPENSDEVNRLAAGDNYGWPEVMGRSDDARFRTPLWTSGNAAAAPTGMAFYTGTEFPAFRGNAFFAAYNDGRLRRIVFENPDRAASVEVVEAAGNRARLDVAMGPDGRLYFTSTDAIYRLRPRE